MKTYIILDINGLIKIGKSIDFKSRFSQLKTANPYIIDSFLIDGDCEKELHKYYNYYLVNGEWFDLRKEFFESKSIMNFKTWIFHEIKLTAECLANKKINNLIEIRCNRNFIK
jgi:hypothetical protein